MTKPTLIDLNLDEYKRRLRYCPFMLNLDRCNGSGNTPGDQSSRICVPKKAADVNVFFQHDNTNNGIKSISNIRIMSMQMEI